MTTPKSVPCPVCGIPLSIRPSRGRKSGKPFIMMVCPTDGRDFRGFITNQRYVAQVFDRLEDQSTEPVNSDEVFNKGSDN